MFAFEPDGEYKPLPARYIALGFKFTLFIALAFYALIISSKEIVQQVKLHHRAIGLSGLVMSAFIVLQAIYPLLPFYAIGCLIANCIIHTYVEVDERVDHARELGSVRMIAYTDALTDVKNKNAYTEIKAGYEKQINERTLKELGIIVFDLNNLKKVNDTLGHEAGDKYLKASSGIICSIFKHSPVFRIGGDEFVTLLEGEDYDNRIELFDLFNKQIEYNLRNGGAVIAGGMDIYSPDKDNCFDEIFERADIKMYNRKKQLKNVKVV
jgi:diguanylate cyclase (GGDEF)-like protein